MALATPDIYLDSDTDTTEEKQWVVLLFNDDISLRGVVIAALQEVLEITKDKAATLMHQAEQNGRAVVFSGSKEDATDKSLMLASWSLRTSVQEA